MKKEFILLVVGMLLIAAGALLKIYHYEYSNYILMSGLAAEAFALVSLVVKSLKKLK